MEPKQTTQMVAWLDEERRKDKALIAKLEERGASQAALIEEQNRRVQALEGELAAVRATTVSVSMFDEAASRLRAEIHAALEQLQARRGSVDQELKKLRDVEREGLANALEELRQEMLTRFERELQPHRTEEERLSRVAGELQNYADNLGKGLGEFERTLGFLEEQRRQDSRRLSDMSSELVEKTKQLEGQKAKVELLEELSRRNERAIGEVSNALTEFKQQRQDWIDQEAIATQQREHMMNDIVRRMDAFSEQMETFGTQFSSWSETHRAMKKQVDDFNRLAERIDRRLNEVAEVQRLSEERFRKEWDEFLQDDQRRWRQFTLANEEAWRENENKFGEALGQASQLDERVEQLTSHVAHLKMVQMEILQATTDQLRSLREQSEDYWKSSTKRT